MAHSAKVEDIEVFRLLRASLLKFAQAADQSISSADSYLQRMRFWLETEQMVHWESQIRLCQKRVTEAKEAVRQKQLYKSATGHNRDATEELKALKKAVAALENAEQKLAACRKWLPSMDRAADIYRGGVSRLRGDILGDIPKAVALLDRLATRLEEYTQMTAPDVGVPDTSTVESSFARGTDELPPEEPAQDKDKAPAPEKKEGADVAHGQ